MVKIRRLTRESMKTIFATTALLWIFLRAMSWSRVTVKRSVLVCGVVTARDQAYFVPERKVFAGFGARAQPKRAKGLQRHYPINRAIG